MISRRTSPFAAARVLGLLGDRHRAARRRDSAGRSPRARGTARRTSAPAPVIRARARSAPGRAAAPPAPRPRRRARRSRPCGRTASASPAPLQLAVLAHHRRLAARWLHALSLPRARIDVRAPPAVRNARVSAPRALLRLTSFGPTSGPREQARARSAQSQSRTAQPREATSRGFFACRGDVRERTGRRSPSPAELAARLPRSARARDAIERGRAALPRRPLHGRRPPLRRDRGPVLDARRRRRARVRRTARAARRASSATRSRSSMRVYFEKPRTTLGWKGLDQRSAARRKLRPRARPRAARARLLCAVNELGVPCATEILDPIVAALRRRSAAPGRRSARAPREPDPPRDGERPAAARSGSRTRPRASSRPRRRRGRRRARPAPAPGRERRTAASRASATRGQPRRPPHPARRRRAGRTTRPETSRVPARARAARRSRVRSWSTARTTTRASDPRVQPTVFRRGAGAVRIQARAPILGAMLESHLFAGRQEPRGGPRASPTACPSPTRVSAGTTTEARCCAPRTSPRPQFRATSG